MLQDALQIIKSFISDIDAVGGIEKQSDGNYGLVSDPEWYDLADTYNKAQAFIEKLEEDEKREAARRIFEQQRQQDAQRAYEDFDFGEATVEYHDGWQNVNDVYTLTVHLSSANEERGFFRTFYVKFKEDTTEILFSGV